MFARRGNDYQPGMLWILLAVVTSSSQRPATAPLTIDFSRNGMAPPNTPRSTTLQGGKTACAVAALLISSLQNSLWQRWMVMRR
jgi:hypothetical protein